MQTRCSALSSISPLRPLRFRQRCSSCPPRSSLFHDTRRNLTPQEGPPLLAKLRRDLKTAMQTKDQNRLIALRGLIADITNASKSQNPPTTDVHILAILRRRVAASQTAGQEFEAANRRDLRDKEDAQVAVLEQYVEDVDVATDEEIKTGIEKLLREMSSQAKAADTRHHIKKGDILKRLLGPQGVFNGKPVEKSKVVSMVDAALSSQ